MLESLPLKFSSREEVTTEEALSLQKGEKTRMGKQRSVRYAALTLAKVILGYRSKITTLCVDRKYHHYM